MGSQPLSVCCVTDASPEQTRASLEALRCVASETVVGVDRRLASRAAEYERFADRVLVFPSGVVEENLAAIHRACTHDWVLRIDSDEIVSPALVARLPHLLASDEVRQYAIARRWVAPGGADWVDEQPWWPDFQVRLVRSATASFSGRLHSSAEPEQPRAWVIEPLLHLNCLLQTPAERQAKVLAYEVRHRSGPGTLREPEVTIYEPERFAQLPPAALSRGERSAVAGFMEAATRSSPRGVRGRTAARSPAAPAAASGGEVEFELLERDLRFEAGVGRTVAVRVTNRSERALEGDAEFGHGVFLAYRWRWADGSEVEGIRTPFPVTVAPGAACVAAMSVAPPGRAGPAWLDLGSVEEHVRWLSGGRRVDVDVAPPAPLPSRREVRPNRGSRRWWRPAADSPAIPHVVHRIWLGSAAMPQAHRRFGETWEERNPGWRVRLWTDADAPVPAGVERARNLGERADLVRYEILRRHGGVYVDTDVECLRALEGLLDGVGAFAGYEVPGRLCNAVIGSTPGHEALTRASRLAAITCGYGTYPEATATTFLTYVLEASDDVTLFGPERFYPRLWDGTENVGDEPPYTDHHWAVSWLHPGAEVATSGPRGG